MKGILYSAAIGAGIALVAFAIDWLAGRLDEMVDDEPLWPPDKPYSRTTTYEPVKPEMWQWYDTMGKYHESPKIKQ